MSLKRVLEPEVMDSYEEALDYDSMDHREVNAAFVRDLLSVEQVEGRVLDLGTGTAQIPVAFCQQTEEAEVLAVDLAVNMLELAKYNIAANGFEHRISLELIDAKGLPFTDEMFDCVMSNSIVHHIPEPSSVLSEAVRVVRPGGLLFFRDLMRPTDEETLASLVQTYAGEENEHQRQMFDDSLHAALTVEEVRALIEPLGFDAQTVQPTSDRHWTWIATKPLAD